MSDREARIHALALSLTGTAPAASAPDHEGDVSRLVRGQRARAVVEALGPDVAYKQALPYLREAGGWIAQSTFSRMQTRLFGKRRRTVTPEVVAAIANGCRPRKG
jgi:hypothetical protein